MKEPPKPKSAAMTSRPWRFSPVSCASMRSMPSSCMVTLSTARTAKLVTMSRKMRFMWVFPSGGGISLLDGGAQLQFNAANGDANH